jgi:hypothetical protein
MYRLLKIYPYFRLDPLISVDTAENFNKLKLKVSNKKTSIIIIKLTHQEAGWIIPRVSIFIIYNSKYSYAEENIK